MKTIILYYTFGGTSRKEANKIAEQSKGAVICEVKEKKKRNIFTTFIPGCLQAMKREKSKIEALPYNVEDYDRIILVSPVWAGFPVPAFNAMVNLLPKEKEVEVFVCSGGGETPKSEEGTKQLILDKGCKLIGYHDIRATQ